MLKNIMNDSKTLKRSSTTEEENDGGENQINKRHKSDFASDFAALSAQMTQLENKLEKQSNAQNSAFDTLNKKVDKLVRLLSDVQETETKMTKAFANLTKIIEQSKPSPPARSVGAFLQNLQENSAKSNGDGESTSENNSSSDKEKTKKEIIQPQRIQRQPVNELDQLKWGQHVYLLGDSLFQNLLEVPDVKEQLEKMKQHWKMKTVSINNAKISDLFNANNNNFTSKVVIPPNVKKVVVSLGAEDLFDEKLKTLKDVDLKRLKLENHGRLKQKAEHIKRMIEKLLKKGKNVIYIIPHTCIQRKEIFNHFEEIVCEVLSEISPDPPTTFKILNLPKLIRDTVQEFNSREEHVNTWYNDRTTSTFADYGCRRFMDCLKRTIWSKGVEGQPPCTRCTVTHPGGAEKCKSIDRMCKQCGLVGHLSKVHWVTDVEFRKLIVQTLGVDIYEDSYLAAMANGETALGVHPIQMNPDKFNDWYGTEETNNV